MKKTRMPLFVGPFVLLLAWAAVLFPSELVAAGENPRLTFAPAEPAVGQLLLFTASNFRTPNLLKWDMGDGTVLTLGGKTSAGQDVTMSYAYAAAGQYLVKVFADGGNTDLSPVTVRVTVSDRRRFLLVDPEMPLANQAAVITALNFHTPEKIAWDLGDGTKINPGDRSGVLVPSFQISHVYKKAGAYTVRAYDNNGDKKLPPLALEVRVAAEKVVAVPVKAESRLPLPAAESVAKPIADEPPPAARKKYPLIKIGPYAGYFRPQDMWLKKLYGQGDVIYGARLGIHIWNGFYIWLSASQYKSITKTTFTEAKSTLTLLPVSAFLRYSLRLGFFSPYAGIGFTYMDFKEESEIGNVTGNGSKTAYEAGFELKMNRHFIVDLGARFDQIKVNPTGIETDLGGVQAGISLLVSF
jgi:uncharacterized protein (DUF2141 family)